MIKITHPTQEFSIDLCSLKTSAIQLSSATSNLFCSVNITQSIDLTIKYCLLNKLFLSSDNNNELKDFHQL